MALVLDTGVVFAALVEGDEDHEACAALLIDAEEQLIVPSPILVELDYWLRKEASVDTWLAFCEDLYQGAYSLWSPDARGVMKAAEIQSRFSDQPIGFVDAAVFVACELLGEEKVATLDARHFSVLRTEQGGSLRLLPGD